MKKNEDRKENLRPNQKIFKVMKITLFLMFVLMFQVKGEIFSQNQRVNLDLENCSVEEFFKEIRKQTGVRFMYKSEYVKKMSRFDVKAKNRELKELLDDVFKGSGLMCLFEENVIVLVKQNTVEPQQKEGKRIKGRVIDKKGAPMVGATVLIKGTTRGVMVDTAGRF